MRKFRIEGVRCIQRMDTNDPAIRFGKDFATCHHENVICRCVSYSEWDIHIIKNQIGKILIDFLKQMFINRNVRNCDTHYFLQASKQIFLRNTLQPYVLPGGFCSEGCSQLMQTLKRPIRIEYDLKILMEPIWFSIRSKQPQDNA